MSLRVGIPNRYVSNSTDTTDDGTRFSDQRQAAVQLQPNVETKAKQKDTENLTKDEQNDVLTWSEDLSGNLSTPSDILFEATLVASSYDRRRDVIQSEFIDASQDDAQLSFDWSKEQRIGNPN